MKYLSPKQLGRAIGVSESSLKRWIDDGLIEATRTRGGHRRIGLAEAVRFVRQRGYTVVDPSVLGLTASDDQTGRADDAQRVEHFHDLLSHGRDKQFLAAVSGLYLSGHSLSGLIDGPIREAMARIGELWHANPEGIGIEHRATDIVIRTLGYMHTLVKPAGDDAPLAIGGAPPGDMHLISSLCISLVLAEQGWREANLGANTPWDQLVHTARHQNAALLWLSVTHPPESSYAPRLANLAQAVADLPCQVVVGGGQLDESVRRLDIENLHVAQSMAELVSFSRGLLVAHRSLGQTGDRRDGPNPRP